MHIVHFAPPCTINNNCKRVNFIIKKDKPYAFQQHVLHRTHTNDRCSLIAAYQSVT